MSRFFHIAATVASASLWQNCFMTHSHFSKCRYLRISLKFQHDLDFSGLVILVIIIIYNITETDIENKECQGIQLRPSETRNSMQLTNGSPSPEFVPCSMTLFARSWVVTKGVEASRVESRHTGVSVVFVCPEAVRSTFSLSLEADFPLKRLFFLFLRDFKFRRGRRRLCSPRSFESTSQVHSCSIFSSYTNRRSWAVQAK